MSPQFFNLDVPAGSGVGVPLDTANLAAKKDFVIGAPFDGTLIIEGSTGGDYAAYLRFTGGGSSITYEGSIDAFLRFVRVRRSQAVGPAPDVNMGAEAAGSQNSEPFEPFVNTINARMTGSDDDGDGTAANPYRTMQRAMLDLVHNPPGGYSQVIDISGEGGVPFYELLPQNFAPPAVHGSIQNDEPNIPGSIFVTRQSFEIRATPMLSPALPAADAVIAPGEITGITYDPTCLLGRIATTKVFVPGALKGKHLIGSITAQSTCVIWDNTASDLLVANSNFDGDPFPAGSTLQIVEPSAILEGPPSTFRDIGVLNIHDASQFGLKGVTLRSTNPAVNFPFAPGYTPGLSLSKCIEPYMELCDIAGIFSSGCDKKFGVFSTVIRDKGTFCLESSMAPRRSYFKDISFNFWASIVQIMRATVFEGATGPACKWGVNEFLVPGGAGLGSTSWEARACLWRNTGPIECHGGVYSFGDVKIQGSAGDGILLQHGGGSGFASLRNVAGGTGVANPDPGLDDPANAGVGIKAWDGGIVQVRDDATLLTGAGGDIQAGTFPVRTWADFRGVAPIKNEYDLSDPFVASMGINKPVGEEITGAGTGGRSGSRIFQRP